MPIQALAVRLLLKRYGWRALKLVVQLVGLEEVVAIAWRWVQNATGTHPDRRRAIRRAEEIGGRIGSALLQDGVHWVVFKDGRPVAAYPSVAGDLAGEMRDYRQEQLMAPDALASRRAQAWFRQRIARLANRDPADASEDGAPSPAGADEFRHLVDQLEPLLKQLTQSPRLTAADHASIPEAAGVFLVSEGPNALYVGQAGNLRERVSHDLPAGKTVQVVELVDLAARTLFEVYAARVLGTDEANVGEPV